MAGLPELNGVFGTFGGMSGLDITPLLAKQRGRMFQQQLAQEAAKMAQQEQLATRGLDLQQRGQDLGVTENDLARKFAENLNNMRQKFDATESEKQRSAVTAAQQRSIQAGTEAQNRAAELKEKGDIAAFEREAPERAARIGANEAAIELNKKRVEIEGIREQRQLAIDDLTKQIKEKELEGMPTTEDRAALRDHEKKMRELTVRKLDLDITELEERAKPIIDRVGLAPGHYEIIKEAVAAGKPIIGPIFEKFARVPGGVELLTQIYGLAGVAKNLERAGQDIEAGNEALTPEAKKRRERREEADTRRAEADARFSEKRAGDDVTGTDPAGNPVKLSSEQVGELRAMQRLKDQGDLGYVGRARIRAMEEAASLGDAADDDAVKRRELLTRFIELSKGLESEGISDLTPDFWDEALVYLAPVTLGGSLAVLAGKKGIQGIERMSESDKQVATRNLINELGYGKTAGGLSSWLFDMDTGTGPDSR